jgi:hypothetical protein
MGVEYRLADKAYVKMLLHAVRAPRAIRVPRRRVPPSIHPSVVTVRPSIDRSSVDPTRARARVRRPSARLTVPSAPPPVPSQLKHPTRPVCGVLLGSPAAAADGDGAAAVDVADAVPMLHTPLGATPSVEIALEHAAAHASQTSGATLVGYYHGNELAGDDALGVNARKIADAVAAVARAGGVDACALVIDATTR